MKCHEIENLLIDYIDNLLDEDTKVKVEDHLHKCQSCKEDYKKTQVMLKKMSEMENETPDNSMRDNFYSMLKEEKNKATNSTRKIKQMHKNVHPFNAGLKYAAVFILFLGIGFLLGKTTVNDKVDNSKKLSELQQQVNNLQNNITVAHLYKPSASERIQAVNTINNEQSPDEDMINALIYTLNNDDNINVRLAAANALTNYSNSDFVKNSLIHSLNKQDDPIMQITLINILVQLQDKRAIQPLKQILENEKNPEIVKEQAKEGLKVFT